MCKMMQNCKVSFHSRIVKEESFSVLIGNLSLINLEPILVQYSTYTSVTWKHEASNAHGTVNLGTSSGTFEMNNI